MSEVRGKLAAHLDSARKLAKSEGRPSLAPVEDGQRDHLDVKNRAPDRGHVMGAYINGTERFSDFY